MTGWLIAFVVVFLFLWLKVGVRVRYDSESMVLKLRVGVFRFALPAGDGEKKPAKKTEKKATDPQKSTAAPSGAAAAAEGKAPKKKMSPSLKSWIKAVLAHWRDLIGLLGKVLRSPTLDLLRLRLDVGGADAEACALTYGRICAGLSAGLPVVHNTFRIKKQDIDVACRFDLPKLELQAEVEATIRIYEIFALVGTILGLLIKLFLAKKRNDKAVQAL